MIHRVRNRIGFCPTKGPFHHSGCGFNLPWQHWPAEIHQRLWCSNTCSVSLHFLNTVQGKYSRLAQGIYMALVLENVTLSAAHNSPRTPTIIIATFNTSVVHLNPRSYLLLPCSPRNQHCNRHFQATLTHQSHPVTYPVIVITPARTNRSRTPDTLIPPRSSEFEYSVDGVTHAQADEIHPGQVVTVKGFYKREATLRFL